MEEIKFYMYLSCIFCCKMKKWLVKEDVNFKECYLFREIFIYKEMFEFFFMIIEGMDEFFVKRS